MSNVLSSASLDRRNLKSEIMHLIRTAILTGELVAGQTYKMGTIGDQLGASRTPVREALLELESAGLVSITRSVGFEVLQPTRKELMEIFELRELLEVPTMQKLAGTLSDEDIEGATALVAQMDEPADAGDLPAFLTLDRDFHVYLTGLAGNARVTKLVADLRDVQRMPGLRRLAQKGELTKRNVEHRELLEAIRDGESVAAGEVMSTHLSLSREAFTVD